jgi:ABC-type glycerol-3-phosphate transport system permease component
MSSEGPVLMEETAQAPSPGTPKNSRRSRCVVVARGHGRESADPRLITHAVLILGVAIIAFPVYVTFVASTITAEEVLAAAMPLVRART